MIGDRIKEERLKKEMTQGELGKAIGVSSSAIGMYEQNRRQPDIATLIKIANYYSTTTDYLLGRTDKPNNEDNDKPIEEPKTIAAHFDGEDYTEEEREDIESFIKNFVVRKREEKK